MNETRENARPHDSMLDLRRWLIAALIRSLARRLASQEQPAPLAPSAISVLVDEWIAVLNATTGQRRREAMQAQLAGLSFRSEFSEWAGALREIAEDLALPTLWQMLALSPGSPGSTPTPAPHELPIKDPMLSGLAAHIEAARAGDAQAVSVVRDLLDEIDAQLPGVDASEFPPSPPQITRPVVTAAHLETAGSRRAEIVERAKRIVGEELQLRLVGRRVPEVLRTALEVGWGPMMAMRLIRHGREGDGWKSGLLLADELLSYFDAPTTASGDPSTLLRYLDSELRKSGLAETRRQSLLAPVWALVEPQSDRDADPLVQGRQQPNPQQRQLLRQIAAPGAWFRLSSHRGIEGVNWVQVSAHDVSAGTVEFSRFDGSQSTTIESRQLIQDLLWGRAEPLEPTPAATAALERLRDSQTTTR